MYSPNEPGKNPAPRKKTRILVALLVAMLIGGVAVYTIYVRFSGHVSITDKAILYQTHDAPTVPDSQVLVNPIDNTKLYQSITMSNPPGHYSLDGGNTWRPSSGAPGLGFGDDPGIAIGPDQTYYQIEAQPGGLGVYACPPNPSGCYSVQYAGISHDFGAHWIHDPVPYVSIVNDTNLNATITTWRFLNGTTTTSCEDGQGVGDYEKVAADYNTNSPFKGYLYIIGDFAVQIGSLCVIQNGFIRSTDGGNTWDRHIIISYQPTSVGLIEHFVIAQSGQILFSRLDGNSCQAQCILFETSKDGGDTWSYTEITDSAQIHGILLRQAPIALSNTGQLAIAYNSCTTVCSLPSPQNPYGSNGITEVDLITSNDNGATWSRSQKISDPSAQTWWAQLPFAYDSSHCDALILCASVFSEIGITYTPIGLAVSWRDWRNSPNGTLADMYAYIPALSSSNIRLTPSNERICAPINGIGWNVTDNLPWYGINYCNDFGQTGGSFVTESSYPGKIFITYGLDGDNTAHCATAGSSPFDGYTVPNAGRTICSAGFPDSQLITISYCTNCGLDILPSLITATNQLPGLVRFSK